MDALYKTLYINKLMLKKLKLSTIKIDIAGRTLSEKLSTHR